MIKVKQLWPDEIADEAPHLKAMVERHKLETEELLRNRPSLQEISDHAARQAMELVAFAQDQESKLTRLGREHIVSATEQPGAEGYNLFIRSPKDPQQAQRLLHVVSAVAVEACARLVKDSASETCGHMGCMVELLLLQISDELRREHPAVNLKISAFQPGKFYPDAGSTKH